MANSNILILKVKLLFAMSGVELAELYVLPGHLPGLIARNPAVRPQVYDISLHISSVLAGLLSGECESKILDALQSNPKRF